MKRLLGCWVAAGLGMFLHAREHVALLGTYTEGEARGIYAVRLDPDTGALSPPELVAEVAHPEFLALHPDGGVLYGLTRVPGPEGRPVGAVAAWAIDAGAPHPPQLRPLNVQPTGRSALTHLAVHRSGRLLVAASYGGGYVAAFPLAADGRVGTPTSVHEQSGDLGPHAQRQDAPHPHSVTFAPDHRFAFVADLGLDRVFGYAAHPAEGRVEPAPAAGGRVSPGAGPRHTAFSPDGQFFYVLNELTNTVAVNRYDAANGGAEPVQEISTLPEDAAGPGTSSEIRVHPSGQFLYTANRGHDSLAVFARDPRTGALERRQVIACGGEQPRNFALTPDGRWLLCAHQRSHSLAVFSVDAASGRLSPVGTPVRAPTPVCVLFLR